MFGLLSLISTIFTVKKAIKEKAEPVAPKGTCFDRDAYYKDIENGIPISEQVKKRQSGGYMTINPVSTNIYDLPLDTVIDVERYEHDKRTLPSDMVENWRKIGHYKYKRNFK